MFKTAMLTACAAVLALAALPAFAGASPGEPTNNPGDPYLEGITNPHFTISGGVATLTGPAHVTCQEITGTGEFEDTETGWVEFLFHGCKGPFGINCTTPGHEAGTVTTTKLTFHLKNALDKHTTEEGVGVLITPNHETGVFAHFECSAFFKITVTGNGIVGTITSPPHKTKSKTATIVFESSSTGVQTHTTVTNDETSYSLKSALNGGAAEASSEDAHGTLTFTEGEPEILTTPEE